MAKAADHTYVECGTGKKAWSCWGGTTGGTEIHRGTGSTKRANAIAEPNERAGIKCYLVNGVCHQAANRILLPAAIIVSAARGYWISEALFGTYGRVGRWPCKAPFNQHAGVSGDLSVCASPTRGGATPALAAADKRYLQGVLELYGTASRTLTGRFVESDVVKFHQVLFMHMAEFRLGALLDDRLSSNLGQLRAKTERARIEIEVALSAKEMKGREFVDKFNKQTIEFQDLMANIMTPAQYESLVGLQAGETVVLADPAIVEKAFKS